MEIKDGLCLFHQKINTNLNIPVQSLMQIVGVQGLAETITATETMEGWSIDDTEAC